MATAPGVELHAQDADLETRLSIVYTGQSLGALGVMRSQEEHELLTEQANALGLIFRLVSHQAWQAAGVAVFTPRDEPEGDELPALIAAADTAGRIENVPALVSNNALLFQDPRGGGRDLLSLIRDNPRRPVDFPDLRDTVVAVGFMTGPRGEQALVVERPGAEWPRNPLAWSVAEMNRVDVAGSRLYELPVNLGQMGPRATVLARTVADAGARSAATVVVDLGGLDGDLGLERPARAGVDFTALQRLGYSILVPYEFELALGADTLTDLRARFPELALLAANVTTPGDTLFEAHRVVRVDGISVGLIGLVDPTIRERLPRNILEDYRFEAPLDAARRTTDSLRLAGVDAIVALSNLSPSENAAIAATVAGIDAIVADLHERLAPEALRADVVLPDRPRSRPGAPALVARGFGFGAGVGRVDLAFRRRSDGVRYLRAVHHSLQPVTDRVPVDTALVRELQTMAAVERRPRGDLLFPAFVELMLNHPELQEFDEVTKQGRVSQRMWQEFLARLLRTRSRAEIAVLRPLSHFPPLIGKLHEIEVRNWLWTEDEIVIFDLLGADLRKIVEEDEGRELVLNGMDRDAGRVGGRPIDDHHYYRVATTDVLFEGVRFHDFEKGKRVRHGFRLSPEGWIEPDADGRALSLREFTLRELRRLRALRSPESHVDRIAALMVPDPPYESLLVFTFDRPTLWVSLNETYHNDNYGTVRESRITAPDSWVVGFSGRFLLTHEGGRFATDAGLAIAYARQSATIGGTRRISESQDDLKFELTFRPAARSGRAVRPFVRSLFDTEFTPTVDFATGAENPKQIVLRGIGGVMFPTGRRWRSLELGAVVENDFGRSNVQFGLTGRADFLQPIGPLGTVLYRLHNDATYLFPGKRDTSSDLALRYNMVHELLIPLVDELSLSVAADLFFFQGKVDATRRPGTSLLVRVGLTYDRIWKPRHQPLF